MADSVTESLHLKNQGTDTDRRTVGIAAGEMIPPHEIF